jgi:ribonuclease T1
MMRLIVPWRATLFVLLSLGAPAYGEQAADPQALVVFASRYGLRDVGAFVEAVQSLRHSGRLPQRYATKDEARAHGWRGGGLCTLWPGHMIGGDVFHNFAGALPGGAGRRYFEADLDSNCAERGAKRLIYSNDGLLFVTVDHYNTFVPVP